MLLGKYSVYKNELCEVLSYDKKVGVVKIQIDRLDKNSKLQKIIKREEIEVIYYIQTDCIYKGYRFQVIGEDENNILIYTSDIDVGRELNMEFRERSVYHKWIKKNEVYDIIEDKTILDI